ncbi:MAG: hypothetical protein ABI759_16395 [Candidatus Solibacter sp.]
MKISRKALTAAFVLAQAVFLLLILTNVLVVDNVRYIFFAIVFVYVAALIGVGGEPKGGTPK